MISFKRVIGLERWIQGAGLGLTVLALTACGGSNNKPQTPPAPEVDASGQAIVEAGDVAIAGQLAAHSILDLPEVADATIPPLVRFTEVSNAVTGPVDTAPYTNLLRDRLLLITREKLRFVERELPPLVAHKKHHAEAGDSGPSDTRADYQILAQLRGNFDDDTYLIRIQFVDLHGAQPLFDGLYRIHKEIPDTNSGAPMGQVSPPPPPPASSSDLESTAPNPAGYNPPVDANAPAPAPPPTGSSSFQ